MHARAVCAVEPWRSWPGLQQAAAGRRHVAVVGSYVGGRLRYACVSPQRARRSRNRSRGRGRGRSRRAWPHYVTWSLQARRHQAAQRSCTAAPAILWCSAHCNREAPAPAHAANRPCAELSLCSLIWPLKWDGAHIHACHMAGLRRSAGSERTEAPLWSGCASLRDWIGAACGPGRGGLQAPIMHSLQRSAWTWPKHA